MSYLIIGDILRRHRLEPQFVERDRLTQKELASLIGCHDSVVSRVERGDQSPTQDYLQRFIEVLHLPNDQAQELWRLLKQRPENFSVPQATQHRENWGEAPDVSVFYGRNEELLTLSEWLITDECRLIAILGMGGIGKTSLVTKLAVQSASSFEYILWRSLRNAPSLQEILLASIQFLSDQQDIEIPEDIDQRITRLINYLAEKRCLIVLDNAEAILQEDQAGHYRDGYENYGLMFDRIGEGRHKSCVLITSREKPREVGKLEGETTPTRSYELKGLRADEGHQLLANRGLVGTKYAWDTLISLYSGNPLALNLVAEMIREVYDSKIDEFLTEDEIIFGQIGDVIGEQFERLSILEQSLIYWLAIHREPISREVLKENLVNIVARRDLMVALRSLRRRSLVEKTTQGFTLQNVVMEYVIERFISNIIEEITTENLSRISFLESFALIIATAKDYIRESQERLILKPIIQRLSAEYSRPEINKWLHRSLSSERIQQHGTPSGYMAGNILNIALEMQINVTEYDFSGLTVKQAYLQGKSLHETNFAGAHFSEVVFTKTLGSMFSIAFSPDGRLIAVGAADSRSHLWQIDNVSPVMSFGGTIGWVRTVSFSPDGCYLATGSDDQIIRIWQIDTGRCLQMFSGHSNQIKSVVFDSTSKYLISGSHDCTVRIWEISTGQCSRILRGHLGPVRAVVLTPDDQRVISCSDDQTIRVWDIQTGECLKVIRGHTAIPSPAKGH